VIQVRYELEDKSKLAYIGGIGLDRKHTRGYVAKACRALFRVTFELVKLMLAELHRNIQAWCLVERITGNSGKVVWLS